MRIYVAGIVIGILLAFGLIKTPAIRDATHFYQQNMKVFNALERTAEHREKFVAYGADGMKEFMELTGVKFFGQMQTLKGFSHNAYGMIYVCYEAENGDVYRIISTYDELKARLWEEVIRRVF